MAKEKQTNVAYTGQGQRQRRSGALKAHLEKDWAARDGERIEVLDKGKGMGGYEPS